VNSDANPGAAKERGMDDVRFDDFSRALTTAVARRGLLRGVAGIVVTGGSGLFLKSGGAVAGRKRRGCRKGRKRCGKKCVRGSCCPGKPCGGQFCSCRRSLAGKTFCSLNLAVPCEQCPAAGCEPGFRCVPGECGVAGVTAVCRPECGTDV
jgi:hypothetical protein